MYIRDQIIQILTLSRREIRQAIDQIDPTSQIYPGWQLRELLAHIAGWDQLLAKCLSAHANGERFSRPGFPETDEFNRQSIEARADLSTEQVSADWETRREELIAVLGAMPPERFEQPLIFPWGQVGTVEDILRGFASHERRHAEEMVALIRS